MPDKSKRVVKIFVALDLVNDKDNARPLITYVFDKNTNKVSVTLDSKRKEYANSVFEGFKRLRGLKNKSWDENPSGVMDCLVARIANQMLMATEES